MYLHLEFAGGDENPLEFWKGQQQNFPLLSFLAKTYLSVAALSRVCLLKKCFLRVASS